MPRAAFSWYSYSLISTKPAPQITAGTRNQRQVLAICMRAAFTAITTNQELASSSKVLSEPVCRLRACCASTNSACWLLLV
ncbi:hypothetical protein D3C73_1582510 [compost metagenome]